MEVERGSIGGLTSRDERVKKRTLDRSGQSNKNYRDNFSQWFLYSLSFPCRLFFFFYFLNHDSSFYHGIIFLKEHAWSLTAILHQSEGKIFGSSEVREARNSCQFQEFLFHTKSSMSFQRFSKYRSKLRIFKIFFLSLYQRTYFQRNIFLFYLFTQIYQNSLTYINFHYSIFPLLNTRSIYEQIVAIEQRLRYTLLCG